MFPDAERMITNFKLLDKQVLVSYSGDIEALLKNA
jgi:hypothetical protein